MTKSMYGIVLCCCCALANSCFSMEDQVSLPTMTSQTIEKIKYYQEHIAYDQKHMEYYRKRMEYYQGRMKDRVPPSARTVMTSDSGMMFLCWLPSDEEYTENATKDAIIESRSLMEYYQGRIKSHQERLAGFFSTPDSDIF